jgi:tRNA pseudouridine38-40 synthase
MKSNKRVKITIEYDGTNYYGWQNQSLNCLPSIQEELEKAIQSLLNKKIQTFVAGRTDRGVHALGQVAHFNMDGDLSETRLKSGLNYYLRGKMISILKVEFVDDDFHARFSVKQKSYIYKIINRYSFLTLDSNRAWLVMRPINLEKMIEASRFLIGYHDFSSFRGPDCQALSPYKTIDEINISKFGDQIIIEFLGKSFLHNQIRIMVGTLKKISVSDALNLFKMKDILEGRDRRLAGETAPGCGLFLNWIAY